MVATLNQPQYDPWPMEEQVVAIYTGINGYLDDIPTPQVQRFQDELREHMRSEGAIYKQIAETGDLPDGTGDLADEEPALPGAEDAAMHVDASAADIAADEIAADADPDDAVGGEDAGPAAEVEAEIELTPGDES